MIYVSDNLIGFRERDAATLLENDVSAERSPSARVTTVTETEDDA